MTAKLVGGQSLAWGAVFLAAGCALPTHRFDAGQVDARMPVASPADASRATASLANGAETPAPARGGFVSDPFRVRAGGSKVAVRIEGFHERTELEELNVDFDAAPDITLRDTEQERTGVRAIIGNEKIAAFVQVFREEFQAPVLLQTEYGMYGVGAGVMASPQIAGSERVKVVAPIRYGFGVAAGYEEVGGWDEEWVYFQSSLEAGVGVRVIGLQPSVGIAINNFVGALESENPSSPAHDDWAVVDGVNVAGYAELLYKPDHAPVVARIRGMFGQVTGVLFSLGVVF